MTTSKTSKALKSFEVQVTYDRVIAYATVKAEFLEAALEASKSLKLGAMLAEGLDNMLDYDARVSGVFES